MIKIHVTKADAFLREVETLTSGRVGLECEFSFSSDWSNLGKTAVFVCGDTKIAKALNTNKCKIPKECLANNGYNLRVGVYGTNGEDDSLVVIPTIWCGIGVVEAGTAITGASNVGTVTATLVDQLTSIVNDIDINDIEYKPNVSVKQILDALVTATGVSV